MQTLISINDFNELRSKWTEENYSVGFVPTMGALHEGHLSLVESAKKNHDKVIVSIFVNPKQFGPNEDFDVYPRMVREDVEKLKPLGVDAVFLPNAADMYPKGFQTYLTNTDMSKKLCGAYREGHFDGVLTVVLKLFNLVKPSKAYFGKKDFQQFRILTQMAKDLYLDVELVGCETVREEDGLAKSSRNLRLSEDERQIAPKLYEAMTAVKQSYIAGSKSVSDLLVVFDNLIKEFPDFRVEYAKILSSDRLEDFVDKIDAPAVFAVAAYLGSVRLIDNIELE